MRPAHLAVSAALMLLPLVSAAGTSKDIEPLKSWTIPAASGQVLEIHLRTGAGLRITAWDKDEVSVASDWTEQRCPDAEFEVTRTADGVLVETRYPAGTEVVTHNCSFAVDIKVPRRYDVRLGSAGGSVAISGVRGDVRGTTGGGMIELVGLRGTVQLRTGGGGIIVQDSDLEGSLATGGGRVRFDNVSGGVTGRSGSMRGIVRGRRSST